MKVDIEDRYAFQGATVVFGCCSTSVTMCSSYLDGCLDLRATDAFDSSDGATLAPSECIEFGALLVRIGEAMKAGATAEDALRAVAGEGE